MLIERKASALGVGIARYQACMNSSVCYQCNQPLNARGI
jgi:hypothetical protein